MAWEDMGVWKYADGVEVDLDRLPQAVVKGLMIRTLAHKFGNEVDASVIRRKEAALKEGKDWGEEEQDAAILELQLAMIPKLYNGEIGLGYAGPRGNSLERIAFELAAADAQARMEPLGAWPKEDRKNKIKAEDAVIDFNGTPMNREQITTLVYEKYKERFDAEAKVERQRRIDVAKAKKEAAVPVKKAVEHNIADLI